jgi:hypothetical protein
MELLVPSQEGNSVGYRQTLTKELVKWEAYGMQQSQPITRNYFKVFLDSPKKCGNIIFYVDRRFEFKVTKSKSL